MAAHNFPSADNSSHTAAQGTSLASQSGRADLPVPPRAPLTVQEQVEFLVIEMTEIISQSETRVLPAPIDSQEGRGYPWEYVVTPSPRATMLSTVATFLSLCLYLAIRAYVSDH
ncbi:hypothetical protein EDD21DRAFT_352895 [Dissophora ornata]|nr:hypothetical protein EDD21DRAFT_352895 [Dissophora ornata]